MNQNHDNLRHAAQCHIDSLDNYEGGDLVPINRTRGTAAMLRDALAAISADQPKKAERGAVGLTKEAIDALVPWGNVREGFYNFAGYTRADLHRAIRTVVAALTQLPAAPLATARPAADAEVAPTGDYTCGYDAAMKIMIDRENSLATQVGKDQS